MMSDGEQWAQQRKPAWQYVWITIRATKSINTEFVQYDAVVDIRIWARNPSEAMHKVRKDPQFAHWYLGVL